MAERGDSMDGDGGHGPTVREAGEKLRRDLDLLRETAERRRGELVDEARRFVDEHPFLAVGAAFGAGYVVSGALFSAATLRLVSYGTRLYVTRALREGLGGQLLTFLRGAAPPAEARPDGGPRAG